MNYQTTEGLLFIVYYRFFSAKFWPRLYNVKSAKHTYFKTNWTRI